MQFSTNLLLAIQIGAAAVFGQEISKPAAWPNLDQFGPTLNTLPRTGTRISPWVSGNISKGCRDRVILDGRDPTKFKAFTVYMDDVSIVYPRLRDDLLTFDVVLDALGFLPRGRRPALS